MTLVARVTQIGIAERNTASAAGDIEGPKIVLPGIKPGRVLQIVRAYVAGTPNDPEVSLVCQLV